VALDKCFQGGEASFSLQGAPFSSAGTAASPTKLRRFIKVILSVRDLVGRIFIVLDILASATLMLTG
jgi:hypothetical protein